MNVADSTAGQSRQGGTQTAPDRVYADLRERIISFDLVPGTTLGRSELAQHYGVSQTPVREALQRLAQDGLVLIYPQSKTVVARINVLQLSEAQFLRVSVEAEVVRRLAIDPPEAVVKRAQALVEMQRTLIGDLDQMDLFSELDRTFHLTLFAGVGMEALHRMLSDRLGQMFRCQRLELPRQGKMQSIVDAHRAVVDGITGRDPERATQAIRDHLSGTISRIETLRAEYPDYFTTDAFR